MINADALYEECKPMIEYLTTKMWYKTGFEREELRAQANFIFMKCYDSFDPNRNCKFGSWLHTNVEHGLMKFVAKNWKVRTLDEVVEVESENHEWNPSKVLEFKDLLNSFSSEAKFVCQLLLDCPDEIIQTSDQHTPKYIRGYIRRHLISIGWTQNKIYHAFHDLREAF